jgi:hypothetical protein
MLILSFFGEGNKKIANKTVWEMEKRKTRGTEIDFLIPFLFGFSLLPRFLERGNLEKKKSSSTCSRCKTHFSIK